VVTTTASAASGAGMTALGVFVLVLIASWILLFAVLIGYLALVISVRSRRQRRRRAAQAALPVPRVPMIPAELGALHQADPHFDEQLLLDAALTATFLVFAAMTTGDIAPIRRLVIDSFWQTPFGVVVYIAARDRRRENLRWASEASAGRRLRGWNVPIDYQPSVPELTAVRVDHRGQRISVRVSFGQLQALVQAGAQAMASTAAASNVGSALLSAGQAFAAQSASERVNSVSWLAAAGSYDLTFVRPANATTDPSAALADRTCTACGATYQSELAIACQHCQAPRALPWGNWRLAEAAPAR
jgi:hypothetical protein